MHLSGPRGKLVGQGGKCNPHLHLCTPCHNPCGHISAPWMLQRTDKYEAPSLCKFSKINCDGVELERLALTLRGCGARSPELGRAVFCSKLPTKAPYIRTSIPHPGGPPLVLETPSAVMRPSPNLLQHGIRLTLFSGKGCSLCHSAKEILAKVHQRRPFEYQEVDTGAKGQEQWRNLYQFDIPVLHVQRVMHAAANPDLVTYTKIIMHRFSEKEVEALMDEAVA